MIIILGYITARSETIDELMVLGLEHTRRSRLEPGCLSHDVSRDVENPNRLLFIERWADLDAVRTHFAVKAAGEFVRQAMSMSDEPPTIELFEASATAP